LDFGGDFGVELTDVGVEKLSQAGAGGGADGFERRKLADEKRALVGG